MQTKFINADVRRFHLYLNTVFVTGLQENKKIARRYPRDSLEIS